jgi:molybdopterin-containing oxidoreductase family iron-sulfur binding subunit
VAIAIALLAAVGGSGSGSIAAAATASGVTVATFQRLADDLRAARPSLVLGGVCTPDALLVAQAAARINKAAGNVGVTIRPDQGPAGLGGAVGAGALAALANELNAGSVRVLFIRGANPVHDLPKASQFREGLARVPLKVSFSSYPDETSQLCDVILPDHHALESWGDSEPVRGTLGLQQPVMDPVFNTRAAADVMLTMARADTAMSGRFPWATYRDFLMARYPSGRGGFTEAVAKGIGQGSVLARTGTATALPAAPAAISGQGDFFLVVHPSPALGAGAGANKPWLQELPDPVSKIAWQSWVEGPQCMNQAQRMRALSKINHLGDQADILTTKNQSLGTPPPPDIGVPQVLDKLLTGSLTDSWSVSVSVSLGVESAARAVALGRGYPGRGYPVYPSFINSFIQVT